MSGVTPVGGIGGRGALIKSHDGFTLLEILVVMTIAALVMVIVPASFSTMVPHVEDQADVKQLVFALRSARGLAIRKSKEVNIVLDLANRQYSLAGSRDIKQLPTDFDITFFAPFPPFPKSKRIEIHFFADGSSSGGRIDMTTEEVIYEISIDWLTGKIGYQERHPNAA